MGNSTSGIYAKYWHLDHKDDFLDLVASLPIHVSTKRQLLSTWSRLNSYGFTYHEVAHALKPSDIGDPPHAR